MNPPLPVDLEQKIDRVCDRFEKAWKTAGKRGQRRPRIEAFLEEFDNAARTALFQELLTLDLAYRRRLGERPTVDDYWDRFLDHGDVIGEVFRAVASPSLPSRTRSARESDAAIPTLAPQQPGAGLPGPAPSASDYPSIPGYEILDVLGRGGMGVVYKARHLKLKRIVALKMILAGDQAGAQHLTRFRLEAEAVAQLQDPNIVQIHEIGEHLGRPFIVLEYVEGGSLAQRVQGQPRDPRESAKLVAVLATAIHTAHENGIVHRDLKPHNVLVTPRGIPKITDFGLAKRQGGTQHTETGTILGTPSYMAPEQASGDNRQIGPRTDVYALGAILYELLTGRPPFLADNPLDTVVQVLTVEPLPPLSLRAGLPRDLENICLKCLEKDPKKRYSTALELGDDLRRFLGDQPVLARPIGASERTWKWAKRHPAVSILSLLSILVTVVGFALVTWKWLSSDYHRQRAEWASSEAVRERTQEARARRRAELSRAGLTLDRGLDLCNQGDPLRGTFWLGRSLRLAVNVPPPETDGGQDAEDSAALERSARLNLAVWRRRLYPLKLCLPHSCSVESVAISPDGQLLLTAGSDWIARLWDASTGELQRELPHDDAVGAVAFSPDGKTIISGSDDGTARLWRTADGQLLRTLTHSTEMEARSVLAVAFRSDGKSVVTGGVDGRARLWDVATGNPGREFKHGKHRIQAVAFSPDGATLLTGADDNKARVWKIDNDKSPERLLDHPRPVLAAAFSHDGKLIVTGSGNSSFQGVWGRVQLWNPTTGEAVGLPLSHPDTVLCVAFSPNDQALLIGGEDGTVRLWAIAKNEPLGPPIRHSTEVRTVAFSPDGRSVLTGCPDGGVRLWDVTATRSGGGSNATGWGDPRLEMGPVGVVNALGFTPDGQSLFVTSHHTGEARLVDAGSLQTQRTFSVTGPAGKEVGIFAGAVSPRQQLVVTGTALGRLQLWDTTTGQQVRLLAEHKRGFTATAFSPDGTLLAGGSSDGQVRFWNVATGNVVGFPLLHRGEIHALAFSPDGKLLATTSKDVKVRLWDVETCQPAGRELEHLASVYAVAFSPDGRQLLSGSADKTARLWDVGTRQPLGPPLMHKGAVLAVTFSPDGTLLLTAGGLEQGKKGEARLWEAVTGKPIGLPLAHGSEVKSVAFHPDGRSFVTAGVFHKVRLWDTPVPVAGDVERVLRETEVLTGSELDEAGELKVLEPAVWAERRRRWQELSGGTQP